MRAHQCQGREFLELSQPAVSVDTKKKELVGDYKNGGREWRPKGRPEAVQAHVREQKDVPGRPGAGRRLGQRRNRS